MITSFHATKYHALQYFGPNLNSTKNLELMRSQKKKRFQIRVATYGWCAHVSVCPGKNTVPSSSAMDTKRKNTNRQTG